MQTVVEDRLLATSTLSSMVTTLQHRGQYSHSPVFEIMGYYRSGGGCMELVAVEPQTMDTADLADRLQELMPDWLAGIDVAPETKQTYRRGLQLFFDWLSRWGQQLGPLAIRTWREELRKAYAPSSVNTWLSGTRSFFSWALEMGLVPYDPTAGGQLNSLLTSEALKTVHSKAGQIRLPRGRRRRQGQDPAQPATLGD